MIGVYVYQWRCLFRLKSCSYTIHLGKSIFYLLQLFLLPLLCICQNVNTFYVPGVAPVEFVKGQAIMVKAVKMTSTRTQLPYEYYSLQFCLPKNGTIVYKSENLGEVLRGDRVFIILNICSIICLHIFKWFYRN